MGDQIKEEDQMDWEWDTGVVDWQVDDAVSNLIGLPDVNPDYPHENSIDTAPDMQTFSEGSELIDAMPENNLFNTVPDFTNAWHGFTDEQLSLNNPVFEHPNTMSSFMNLSFEFPSEGNDFTNTRLDTWHETSYFNNTVSSISAYGMAQACSISGCFAPRVNELYCFSHERRAAASRSSTHPTCKRPGCLAEETIDGFCFEHWNGGRCNSPFSDDDPSSDNSKLTKCKLTGCMKIQEPPSLFCTDHKEGDDYSETQARRRLCESENCMEQKRKGLYCERHWNELNPSKMLCESPRCCTFRVKEELLCIFHLREKYPTKTILTPSRNICRASGCINKRRLGGLCGRHYKEKHPEQKAKIEGVSKNCQTIGCTKKVRRNGLCFRHLKEARPGYVLCEFPECTKKKVKGGFCKEHGYAKKP